MVPPVLIPWLVLIRAFTPLIFIFIDNPRAFCYSVSDVAVVFPFQDPGDVVPVGQRRAWCWCMCFGLAFMLAGVILGGAYLYKNFALQVSRKIYLRFSNTSMYLLLGEGT